MSEQKETCNDSLLGDDSFIRGMDELMKEIPDFVLIEQEDAVYDEGTAINTYLHLCNTLSFLKNTVKQYVVEK
jgi:hypothetical protein